MNPDFPGSFFVTGTDTDIGKTVVCAVLMAGIDACYWKPVQTGISEGTDTDWIREVSGLPQERFLPEKWRLTEPLSPHSAAEIDGVAIDLDDFRLPNSGAHLIVEGAGGLMVPLNEKHLMVDLICRLGLPAVLVARSGLGTINHTLLSLEKLRRAGVETIGVIMNGPKNDENRRAIEKFGRIRVLAQIEPIPVINAASLRRTYLDSFTGVAQLP